MLAPSAKNDRFIVIVLFDHPEDFGIIVCANRIPTQFTMGIETKRTGRAIGKNVEYPDSSKLALDGSHRTTCNRRIVGNFICRRWVQKNVNDLRQIRVPNPPQAVTVLAALRKRGSRPLDVRTHQNGISSSASWFFFAPPDLPQSSSFFFSLPPLPSESGLLPSMVM